MIDELAQYQTDRPAWHEQAAIKLSGKIPAMSESKLSLGWSLMTRDYQKVVWSHLDETQRARVRALRGRS